MTEDEVSKIKNAYKGYEPIARVLNISISHVRNLHCSYRSYHGENSHLRKSEKIFMTWDVADVIAKQIRKIKQSQICDLLVVVNQCLTQSGQK